MGLGGSRRRDEPSASWNRLRPQRRRKQAKRWCRGKEGVYHDCQLQPPQEPESRCSETPSWWRALKRTNGQPWWCGHQMVCANCGKLMEHKYPWFLCPDLPPQYQAEADQRIAQLTA